MKSFAVLALGATMAMAQSVSDLPQCGQTCISNMLAIATNDFGCTQGDVVCYCNNADFGYGVRDCANEACGSEQAASVIAYGTNYCAGALSSASGSATASTASASGASVLSSAASGASATATGTEGSGNSTESGSGSGAGASSTPYTTQPLVATVSASDTTYATTTGQSTLYTAVGGAAASASESGANATESAGSAASSATDSAGSAASSATESASGAASSAVESASSAASGAASSAASGASGAASSASSAAGAAPMKTAAPMLGAAGMALLFAL